MSKTHKYDVFISCGGTASEAARTLIRQLETNGFVSSSRALDFANSSSIDEVIQDFYQSAVCLLVYGKSDHVPWFDGRIGRAIKRRADLSRGAFRVISILSYALRGWNRIVDSRDRFIDSDSVIEYEHPFDDAAKFQELVWLIRGARQTPHSFFSLPRLRQWIARRAKNALSVDWSRLSTMSPSPLKQTLAWIDHRLKLYGPVHRYGTVPNLKTGQPKLFVSFAGTVKPEHSVGRDLIVDSILRSHIRCNLLKYYDDRLAIKGTCNTLLNRQSTLAGKTAVLAEAKRNQTLFLPGLPFCFEPPVPRAKHGARLVNLPAGSATLGTVDHCIAFCSAPVRRAMISFHNDTSQTPGATKIRCERVLARLPNLNDWFIVINAPQVSDLYNVPASAPNDNNDDKTRPLAIRDLLPERLNYLFSSASPLMVLSAYRFQLPQWSIDEGSSDGTIVFDNLDAATIYLCSGTSNGSPSKVEPDDTTDRKWAKGVEFDFVLGLGLKVSRYESTPDGLRHALISYDGSVKTADLMKVECCLDKACAEDATEVTFQREPISCQGRLVTIPENDLLFRLIGTTYGGDGRETFVLPDLRGVKPIHIGEISENSHPEITFEVTSDSVVVVSPWNSVRNPAGTVEERIQ